MGMGGIGSTVFSYLDKGKIFKNWVKQKISSNKTILPLFRYLVSLLTFISPIHEGYGICLKTGELREGTFL
jgi:hypothetical protein